MLRLRLLQLSLSRSSSFRKKEGRSVHRRPPLILSKYFKLHRRRRPHKRFKELEKSKSAQHFRRISGSKHFSRGRGQSCKLLDWLLLEKWKRFQKEDLMKDGLHWPQFAIICTSEVGSICFLQVIWREGRLKNGFERPDGLPRLSQQRVFWAIWL